MSFLNFVGLGSIDSNRGITLAKQKGDQCELNIEWNDFRISNSIFRKKTNSERLSYDVYTYHHVYSYSQKIEF